MAAFQQDYSATQDDTGLVTFHDDSTWDVSDEHYDEADFVRKIDLVDAYGVFIATVIFPPLSLITTYQLLTNKWIVGTYDITGVISRTKIHKFGFQRLFEVAFIEAKVEDCNCGCIHSDVDMCDVISFYLKATFAAPIGDGVSYQTNIDSAFKLLS